MKKALGLADFLDYAFPSRLTPSPDTENVAFIVSKCDYKANRYHSDVYIFNRKTRTTLQITKRGDIRSVTWIDDETLLIGDAKSDDPAKVGKSLTCYHSIKADGTDEKECFVFPQKVFSIRRVDSHRFVVLAEYYMGCPDDAALEKRRAQMSQYLVYDEIPYHRNGRGYINKTRQRLYLCDIEKGTSIPVSDETENVDFYSTCKNRIVYNAKHYGSQKRKTFLNGLTVYDISQRKITPLIDDERFRIKYSGFLDGRIVFAAADGKRYGYAEENLCFRYYDEDRSCDKVFAFNEYSTANTVGSDTRFGVDGSMSAGDNGIYFLSTRGGDAHIFHAAMDGTVKQVSFEPGAVNEFIVFDDEIIMIAMRGNRIDELYSLKNEKEEKLTSFNDWVVNERTLSTPERITFENDGVVLEGYVMKPTEYKTGKKYPGVLTIHGGHKCTYGSVFYHEMQCWANQGFFVIFCNPRGSDGRDNAFGHIVGKYGNVDFSDIMRFTDICVERYPDLDGTRLGVAGGSYGGFLTNWIIGHTNRFKCAISQRSISSWIYHFGTSDTGYQAMLYETSGDNVFWKNVEAYWDQSPLKYAHNCVTPTLFIHADEDYRCPVGHAEEMFTVLQYNGVPSRMCVFKGENHELSRSGKPINRLLRLEEIIAWLEKYLK